MKLNVFKIDINYFNDDLKVILLGKNVVILLVYVGYFYLVFFNFRFNFLCEYF